MYSLKLSGPADHLDEAIDRLLSSGYDLLTRPPHSITAYGKCPFTAGRMVRDLGWKASAAKPSENMLLGAAA